VASDLVTAAARARAHTCTQHDTSTHTHVCDLFHLFFIGAIECLHVVSFCLFSVSVYTALHLCTLCVVCVYVCVCVHVRACVCALVGVTFEDFLQARRL
jgi:hypothetical protein